MPLSVLLTVTFAMGCPRPAPNAAAEAGVEVETGTIAPGTRPIVEELREANALIARVANAIRDRRIVEHGRSLGITPREECIDDGA
ncbi:MAG TPA: hypothetical protein VM925_01850 [Labilithrix sp.]|jgi:hypothetical protein|nr:hypothetical protein [Labilithrix sp.]